MAIFKEKSTPYFQTRFTVKVTINGKEYHKRAKRSTRTTEKQEALRIEALYRKQVEDELIDEIRALPQEKTWAHAEKKWLEEKGGKRSIRDDLSKFSWLAPKFRHLPLSHITWELISELIETRKKDGVKPATINRLLALIRSVLIRARDVWLWTDKAPKIILLEGEEEREEWLTQEAFSILYKELPDHLKKPFLFALCTGLRAGNVSGLKKTAVDLTNRYLLVRRSSSKNKKPICVPLNDRAMSIIHEALLDNQTDFVFTYQGRPIKQFSTRAWRKALNRAGITNFHWHDLRHTFASWHLMSGTSELEIQKMGVPMTKRYGHMSNVHLVDASNNISKFFNDTDQITK